MLAPIGVAAGLGQERNVFGNDAGFEADIGVGVALGRVVEPDARRGAVGVGEQRRIRDGLARNVADAGDDVVKRQKRRRSHFRQQRIEVANAGADFALWSGRGEIAGDERDLGVRFRRRRRVVGTRDAVGQQLLRIERRNVGRHFGLRQRKIAGHAHEAARSDELAVAHARDDRYAHDLAGHARLADAREPVCFVDPAQAAGESADCSAQSHFDAFRGGGKIGLAVERSKNGASHQGGAAQAGQDRAAEPLHGNPAAADQAAGAAVDRKRRLVAEIKSLGLKPPICAAQLCRLVQDRCPPHSRPTVRPSGGSPVCLRTIALSFAPRSFCAKATMPPPIQSGRLDGRDQSTMFSGAPPGMRIPRRELCKNGGGMWPQCGVRTGFNGRICGGLRKVRAAGWCAAQSGRRTGVVDSKYVFRLAGG